MHASSYEKVRAFRNAYLHEGANPIRVLDVGAGSNEGGRTYRSLFADPSFDYVGLDVEPGPNVDVVPADPFNWSELGTESVDVVVSGQTFEHNPYFWITTAEIARVLVSGGVVAVVAPSKGHVHRFPLDCWRFYPDAWSSLCAYVGLELLEGYTEQSSWRVAVPGIFWGDAMMVARKPVLAGQGKSQFYERLATIVATRTPVPQRADARGPAGGAYEQTHWLAPGAMAGQVDFLAARSLKGLKHLPASVRRARRHLITRVERRALARGEATLPWPPPPEH